MVTRFDINRQWNLATTLGSFSLAVQEGGRWIQNDSRSDPESLMEFRAVCPLPMDRGLCL